MAMLVRPNPIAINTTMRRTLPGELFDEEEDMIGELWSVDAEGTLCRGTRLGA